MRDLYDYVFTGKTREFEGSIVHQIALFGGREIGGWIEKEENLISPAWIGEDAIVCGDSIVSGGALVDGDAVICGNSRITGAVHITGCARIKDSLIRGTSRISHQAFVDNSTIEDSIVDSSAKVENAELKFCIFTGWADVKGGKYYNKRYDGQYWLR